MNDAEIKTRIRSAYDECVAQGMTPNEAACAIKPLLPVGYALAVPSEQADWWKCISPQQWGFVSPDDTGPPICMDAVSASLSGRMRAVARSMSARQSRGGERADET